MAACPDFTWSDTISGYVTRYDAAASTVELATSDQRRFRVELDGSTAAEFLRNLGEPYVDADVVVDGVDLVTGRTGQHAHLFARAVIDMLIDRGAGTGGRAGTGSAAGAP